MLSACIRLRIQASPIFGLCVLVRFSWLFISWFLLRFLLMLLSNKRLALQNAPPPCACSWLFLGVSDSPAATSAGLGWPNRSFHLDSSALDLDWLHFWVALVCIWHPLALSFFFASIVSTPQVHHSVLQPLRPSIPHPHVILISHRAHWPSISPL